MADGTQRALNFPRTALASALRPGEIVVDFFAGGDLTLALKCSCFTSTMHHRVPARHFLSVDNLDFAAGDGLFIGVPAQHPPTPNPARSFVHLGLARRDPHVEGALGVSNLRIKHA